MVNRISEEVAESNRNGLLLTMVDTVLGTNRWMFHDLDRVISSKNSYGFMYCLLSLQVRMDYDSSCAVFRKKERNHWTVLFVRFYDRMMRCFVGEGQYWEEIRCNEDTTGIDLDTTGRRWEGSIMDSKPCGYGVLYDEENRVEYEGIMFGGRKTCFGKEYYSDINKLKYVGCYYDDDRCGKGILYTRDGTIDYDGMWVNNHYASSEFNGYVISSYTESVVIPNNLFSKIDSFALSSWAFSLKQMEIGDNCFGGVRFFSLDGLKQLESIVIRKECFRIGIKEQMNGSCRIMNYPKLQSIHIGDNSFYNYHSFELKALSSLRTLHVGINCFFWVTSFSLTGMTD